MTAQRLQRNVKKVLMPFFKVVNDIARYLDSLNPTDSLEIIIFAKFHKTEIFPHLFVNPGKDSKFYSISKYTGMTEFMAPGKMKIIKHHSKSACEVKVPMYPKDEDAMNEPLRFALSRDLLRKKFDSPEHCALWLFPYRTIVFKGLIKLKN